MTSSLIIRSAVSALFSALFARDALIYAQTSDQPPSIAMTWGDRPSIHFGTAARIDLRLNLQVDARESDAALTPGGSVAWARKRVGVDGVVARVLGFQVEGEIDEPSPWRDVYVNYQQFDAVQLQAGQFKLPFSREQTTSAAKLDFVYRSRVAALLAPGRDRGVMVHGRVIADRLSYEAGTFTRDGDNARHPGPERVAGGRTIAARVTARPFRSAHSAWRTVEAGVAGTWSDIAEGFPGFQGETQFGEDFYEAELWVQGSLRRRGVEFRWRPGPFSLTSEYIRLAIERRAQGVEGTDLSPFVADGWYVSGTWTITGETKTGAFGAVEAAVRVEALGFSSEGTGEPASASPRAEVVLGRRLEALTIGMNWHPMRWLKVQVNAIREVVTESGEAALLQRPLWSQVLRLQFAW